MKKYALVALLFLVLIQPSVVSADPVTATGASRAGQEDTTPAGSVYNINIAYTPLEPLLPFQRLQSGNITFGELLDTVLRLLIAIAGMIAVGALVFGGVAYMVSDIVNEKAAALGRIRAALLGLLLVLASYMVLNTINPQLVTFSNVFDPVYSQVFVGSPGTVPNGLTADQQKAVTLLSDAKKAVSGGGGVLSVISPKDLSALYSPEVQKTLTELRAEEAASCKDLGGSPFYTSTSFLNMTYEVLVGNPQGESCARYKKNVQTTTNMSTTTNKGAQQTVYIRSLEIFTNCEDMKAGGICLY